MWSKTRNTKIINILFTLNLIIGISDTKSDEKLRIRVGENEFIGTKKVILEQSVSVFAGIPYAEPPLADLRFRKPLPVRQTGVVDAQVWPKACPQLGNVPQSEDCLKLNVWTTDSSASKAVMVWFHGGGFVSGFGHNGEVLAVTGDVVVVTVNYRLGALGFLYSGRDDSPGNMGLWDQVLALEWVNDNIRYFGGNPEQITIFGFSAGSRSISLHLLSPHSRQLFKNAIMMSGSAFSLLSNPEPSYVQNIYSKLAQSVGCNTENGFTDKTLKCLRGIPSEKLVLAQHSSEVLESKITFNPNMIFGDQFIPEKPLEALKSKGHKKKINLLIGTTEDEGSWILNRIDGNKYALNKPDVKLSKSEAMADLENIFNSLEIEPRIDGELIAKFYLERVNENNSELLRKSMGIGLGDFFISCPALKFADILFRNNEKHNKIYGFYWTSKLGAMCGQWAGACHGSDVGPAFGYPFRKDKSSDLERNVSTKFMKTISHFAKHDHPPAQEGIEWPRYYSIDSETVPPYYEFSTYPKNVTNFNIGLKLFECEKIWNKYFV